MFADSPLWCINTAAQRELSDCGISGFIYSLEDDFPNVKHTVSGAAAHYLYTRAPLFISRISVSSEISANGILSDPHGNEFTVHRKHGLQYLISPEPLPLTNKKVKLTECAVHDFIIDLSFMEPDESFLAVLISAYKNESRIENTTLFNFKAGLK